MLKTNFNKSSGNPKEDTFDIRRIIINNERSGSRVSKAEKFKANQQRNSEQSAQTFKVSWQKIKKKTKRKKNPISTKKFKQYQVSAAKPQLKIATLERS